MVICITLSFKSERTKKLFLGNICKMPIMSDVIKRVVAKFGDSHSDVCNTASNGFAALVKHSNLCGYCG